MSWDQQRLVDYLRHISEAIARIQRYVDDIELVGFLQNELVQDGVIRNLEIIGEASRNIEKHFPEFANQNEDVPFYIAYEMRNALAHGYFKVDLEVVWNTIEQDLPGFEASVTSLINKIQTN